MCISHRYEQVLPDGRIDRWAENDLCHKSRHNKLCDYTQVLQHPAEPYHPDQLSSSYGRMQFPPTPPMSAHSASTSDSERSTKRRSGSYTLDQKVLEINNSKRSSRREKEDRTYIDRTPISRTPPRQLPLPGSAHSSPDRASYHSHESRRRESNVSERDRPTTIKIEIAGSDRSQKTHRRTDTSSSRASKTSSRDSSDDGSERRRRRQSVAFVETDQELQRKLQLESEIARANAAIANRPVPPPTNAPAPAPASKPAPATKTSPTNKPATTASKPAPTSKPAPISAPTPAASGPVIKPARLPAPVPVSVPPPSSTTSSARYRRGSVVVDPLVSKMNNLQLDVQYDRRREMLKQAEKQAERDEEEAQKRRLMERMAPRTAEPKRRATVGAAQRRHKVQYEDGLYRFE
ncbi:hypothetical protein F5X96DRAFT_507899 [Biscogniauxia mediterranea]|nr:hypothetical protein F5X96DRAFT_507899 [Biscogniauxia mediterranea]